jgi:putative N6-adenine-specific DNA methylase
VTVNRYFATCARGLEPILADELRALKARDVTPGRGGVAFAGGKALLYLSNLWLRTAVRVLRPLLEAPVQSPEELYAAVQTLDWQEHLTPEHTLAVDCNVRDSRITHSQYAARVVKDAICDQFIARLGRRPSVDPEQPMVGLNLHIHKDQAVLSLDSSWDSLHKRGYRPIQTKAPLNEALAAALVLRSGWRGEGLFVDPLCGSGTLPIEAAWVALKRPPGLTRRHFGFQGWMDYDVRLWTDLRDEARRSVGKRLAQPVVGSDARRDAVEFARTNARAAGVGHLLRFDVRDVRDFQPPDGPPGTLICNPPYGERIGEEKELRGLYRTLGDVFRRCPGWGVWVFTGNQRLAGEIDLPRAEEVPLFNGKIPCRLIRFEAS